MRVLLRRKSDAAELFEQFLAGSRADGVPSKVVIVRSNGSGEFRAGNIGDLCSSRRMNPEFTTTDSAQINGVAERALAWIETAAMKTMNPGSISFSRRTTPGPCVVVGGSVPLGL